MARSLFDYFERFAHVLPEALNTWRAQSPDGFLIVSERLLATAITHLEEQAKNFRGAEIKEDAITSAAIGFFNRFGIRASSQTNSRGHVDLYIRHSWQPSLVICGEAKIWNGVSYHIGGLTQVLGYATGRTPFCFVLIYVRTGAIADHVHNLRIALENQKPNEQQGECCEHGSIRWALVTNHQHSSGILITALHAGVNLA